MLARRHLELLEEADEHRTRGPAEVSFKLAHGLHSTAYALGQGFLGQVERGAPVFQPLAKGERDSQGDRTKAQRLSCPRSYSPVPVFVPVMVPPRVLLPVCRTSDAGVDHRTERSQRDVWQCSTA